MGILEKREEKKQLPLVLFIKKNKKKLSCSMDERMKRLKGNKLCKDVRQSPGFDMLFAACGSLLAFGSEKKGVKHQAPIGVQDTASKCQINTVYVCIYHLSKRCRCKFFMFFYYCF